MIFNFCLGPGGPGGGSGLPFSQGNRRLWADSGPNPDIFNFDFGLFQLARITSAFPIVKQALATQHRAQAHSVSTGTY